MKRSSLSSLHAAAPFRDPTGVAAGSSLGTSNRRAIAPRLTILAMIFAVLGIPITDPGRFLLLLASVIAVAFGTPSELPKRWLLAVAITIAVVASEWLLPIPRFEEGENVYIPMGKAAKVFEQELPAGANARMKAEFDRTYLAGTANSVLASDENSVSPPRRFLELRIEHAFSPSADALWQQPEYSRILEELSFSNQEQARIGAINRLLYNFYLVRNHPKRLHAPGELAFENNLNLRVARIGGPTIDRNRIPFFVMAELNHDLLGGTVCWRGDVLWEVENQGFDLLRNAVRACRQVTNQDAGKRVFALSIGSPISFALAPPLKGRVFVWIRGALLTLAVLALLRLLVTIRGLGDILLPVAAAVSTLVTTTILWPDYLLGFHTLPGGNDGLTHESMGFDIAQALHAGRWAEALRGGESIFYYMPGLRYFRALEQFIFGETNFGMLLCTMFFPVFLYYLLRRLLPPRWSLALICIFLFTPIFERLGFAHFVYLREMIKGFPEPVGYTAFLGGMALLAQYVPTHIRGERPAPMPSGWIGFALAMGVALRPNLALPAVLILGMTGYWLLIQKRWGEATGLTLGFAPVLLIAFHNWYFGHEFVPLTSSAFTPDNLTTPPSVYWAAIEEVNRLDFSGGATAQVLRQLSRWNEITDFYRVIAVLIVAWILLRPSSASSLRGLALVALSMQAILLFYIPSGRYALLAWLLVFTLVIIELSRFHLRSSQREPLLHS